MVFDSIFKQDKLKNMKDKDSKLRREDVWSVWNVSEGFNRSWTERVNCPDSSFLKQLSGFVKNRASEVASNIINAHKLSISK